MPLSPCALTLASRCYKVSWPTVDSNIVGLHALPTSVTFSVFYANLFPASLELFTIDLFMPKKRRYVSPYSSHLVLHLHPISQCSVADASGEVLSWIKEGTESRVILHCEVRGLWLKLPLHALLQLYCPSRGIMLRSVPSRRFFPHWIYLGIIGQVKLECPRAGNPISFDYWLRILHFVVSY